MDGQSGSSGREAYPSSGIHTRGGHHGQGDNRPDPVEDLKRRLSEWGESAASMAAKTLRGGVSFGGGRRNDEEEVEEYELLLDPNLPEMDDNDRGEPMPLTNRRAGGGSSNAAAAAAGRRSSSSVAPFDDEAAMKRAEVLEEEDSPYPEVRAAVRNYDEDLPCNTIRAWTIGLTLVFVGASMNTLFSLRAPSIGLGALIAQIIAWPIGHGWARIMPTTTFRTFGYEWSLNPGPFNIKEHSIIVVMAAVSFSVAYATDILLAQLVFYKQDFGLMFQILLVVSTQSLGYGIAGMLRKFLGELSTIWRAPIPILTTSAKSVPGIHDMAR